MTALPLETLEERIAESELGKKWILDPLMQQDIWSLTDLGYTPEECQIKSLQNINFSRISLPWLKLLTKLTVKARAWKRQSMGSVLSTSSCLLDLNNFLVDQGYTQPFDITDGLLSTFISQKKNTSYCKTLGFTTRLWREEGWLKLSFTRLKFELPQTKIETIPEFVLHQIYENLDILPVPLERLFRLQIALGCRVNEILRLPLHCLKKEGESWFLLQWVAKRKQWRYYQVHPLIAELVLEQQKFLKSQFGVDSTFDKLFCKVSTSVVDGVTSSRGRFKVEPVYQPSCCTLSQTRAWLKAFSIEANLRDKYGNPFHLTSHMFRRTKASIMAYCEVEDEYIAAILGHGSLDMLPHYRKRSIERLEKEAQTKGYVDMYGRVTAHSPRKQRYEKLTELLKVSTPLGECHRPTMLGDCQARYACLSCTNHRVTKEDLPKLENDRQRLEDDLNQSQLAGQQRRVTEIEKLLELVNNRLRGLEELQTLTEVNYVQQK